MQLNHPTTPLVIFSHGNSFPGGTYSQLTKGLETRGYNVKAIDRFGHDPRYPVTNNWPHLVDELAAFAATEMAKAQQPAWLVGHSMGGILSLMCAAKHRELAGHNIAGVLMMDSPVLTGWRSKLVAFGKLTRLIGSVSPGRVSRQRRNTWPSQAAAMAQWSTRPIFSTWAPASLADYVAFGTQCVDTLADGSENDSDRDSENSCTLRFDRQVETQIYNTLPHNVDSLLARHPIACPVSCMVGSRSVEMRRVGATFIQRLVGSTQAPRWQVVDGSHLFPLESPAIAADMAANALADMATT